MVIFVQHARRLQRAYNGCAGRLRRRAPVPAIRRSNRANADLPSHVVLRRSCSYALSACPVGTFILFLIIVLPISFHNVEYDEMAFFKRRSTGTIDRSKVYKSGRHFIGPDGFFVKFPTSLQAHILKSPLCSDFIS
jgi:hypothetical protein